MFNPVSEPPAEAAPAGSRREELVNRFIRLQWRLGHAIRTRLTTSLGAGDLAVSAAIREATPHQRAVLLALHQEGPLAMGELARHLGVTASSATELVDRLVEHGWVERLPVSGDRRAVVVQLTAPAREMAEQARGLLLSGTQALLADLDDRDLTTLVGLLERVAGADPAAGRTPFGTSDCQPPGVNS
jgi:DNA-binding MarR family transcriptional regulator